MNSLSGFEVVTSSAMIGMKKAVKFGRRIYVSPALSSLMTGASSEELERLLFAVEVVDMGDDPFASLERGFLYMDIRQEEQGT